MKIKIKDIINSTFSAEQLNQVPTALLDKEIDLEAQQFESKQRTQYAARAMWQRRASEKGHTGSFLKASATPRMGSGGACSTWFQLHRTSRNVSRK